MDLASSHQSLRVDNAALEAKLRDSLTSKIHDLQNDVKKKRWKPR
jgi:hypothetical protein